jgi:hypothetical protein
MTAPVTLPVASDPTDAHVDGGTTVYRLYDVGYAIGLDRAASLLGDHAGVRIRPARDEARAIEIRNPPLSVSLGSRAITVAGASCVGELSAHLFDFGVCSLRLRVPSPPNASWSEFVAFGTEVERVPDLGALLSSERDALLARIAAAIDRPAVAPLAEEYTLFHVSRLAAPGNPRPADFLTDERLVPLLLGEQRPLSATARRELLPFRFSYYEDDFAALAWNSAIVVEPRNDRDVEYVLEFANAQLLELRLFDMQLDAELPALYQRAAHARARRMPSLAGRFRAVLSDLQTRVADVTETVERVENALKVTNDVYLARIYAAALELFRTQAWRVGIQRKLDNLRETYAMLNGEAQAARAELLELTIIALIVAELVLGIWRS